MLEHPNPRFSFCMAAKGAATGIATYGTVLRGVFLPIKLLNLRRQVSPPMADDGVLTLESGLHLSRPTGEVPSRPCHDC